MDLVQKLSADMGSDRTQWPAWVLRLAYRRKPTPQTKPVAAKKKIQRLQQEAIHQSSKKMPTDGIEPSIFSCRIYTSETLYH